MRVPLAALFFLSASVAHAEEWVAVDVAGKPWLGRDSMQAALQSAVEAAALPLVPAVDFAAAKKKHLRRRKKKRRLERIAAAGRSVGARWILFVELAKKPKKGEEPFLAKARLIDAERGDVAVRFATRYGKGGAEATAAAIAQRVLGLLAPGHVVKVADDLPAGSDPAEEISNDESSQVDEVADDQEEPVEAPIREAPEPVVQEEPAIEVEPDDSPSDTAPAETVPLGRLQLGAGSGWLRSVAVSGESVEDSALSHTLGPKPLIAVSGEVIAPSVGLGAKIDLAVRPVKYVVETGDENASQPGGTIFDMFVLLLYRLDLGRLAVIPHAGARLSIASVDEHANAYIPGTRTVGIIGGAKLRVPLGPLEIDAGGHAGYIPLYREAPSDTGRSKGGFTAGAVFSLRAHLAAGLGLALDNRLGFDSLGFEDVPSRGLPPDEPLANAQIDLLEITSSLAATYTF